MEPALFSLDKMPEKCIIKALNHANRNALTGTGVFTDPFQRAAGGCEAARREGGPSPLSRQLNLEGIPRAGRIFNGSKRVRSPAVILGSALLDAAEGPSLREGKRSGIAEADGFRLLLKG